MLADEYRRLIKRLWQRSVETIEKHGGIVGQDSDNGLVGYFLPSTEKFDTPICVIECALELKAQMVELGREWKIRKGWFHDLKLTIGIHSEEEYLGLLRSSVGDSLALFGRSLKIASYLAQMGTQDQIWTTKSLINKLPADKLKQLRFGIFRQDKHRQVFISRCFSKISDLRGVSKHLIELSQFSEVDAVVVTQIFDL
jgi:class 3 adenylate cyclase